MVRKQRSIRPPKFIEHLSWLTLCLLALTCLAYFLNSPAESTGRELRSSLCVIEDDDNDDGDDDGDCPEGANPPGMIVLYIIGILYLFVAIAIVCDDFFVPPLESIAEIWNMNDDVAGATLMAAGGSAPELATSLIGTFSGSDVGFGTIVGSAVFNVLFVIACCVMFTPPEKSPLELTAWPLARDCSCYIFCLLAVAFVFGLNTPGIIEGWEAAFLFFLYICYCTIMAYNEELYDYFTEKFASSKVSTTDPSDGKELEDEEEAPKRRGSAQFYTHYRGSILQMMGRERSIFDTAAVHCIKNIEGDVKEVFDTLDADKSGSLESTEIKTLLEKLLGPDAQATDEHVTAVMKELDVDQNGSIDFAEFTVWYVQSEERLKHEERTFFVEVAGGSGDFIYPKQINMLLHKLEVPHSPEQLDEAMAVFGGPESNHEISYEEFSRWFEHSDFWKEKQHDAAIAAEAAEGVWGELLDFPKENWKGNLVYLILAPITWPLACTAGIRDVRVPGNSGWAFFQFFVSIGWIGAYSYILVSWVETVGATLGIPAVVMGLTILAAGTSIPDLLSSIVVAKAGKGDMAVSSSIGSNIFDVTVGLPVPWMLFNLVMDCPVVVGADNLFISVFVLLGMVAAVIFSIMMFDWKMNKNLGISMMVLYVIFLAQDVARVYLTEDIVC